MTTSKPSTINVRAPSGCLAFVAFLIIVALAVVYYVGPLNIALVCVTSFFLALGFLHWPQSNYSRHKLKIRLQCAALWLAAAATLAWLIYRTLP